MKLILTLEIGDWRLGWEIGIGYWDLKVNKWDW